jgi:hypothetical protein
MCRDRVVAETAYFTLRLRAAEIGIGLLTAASNVTGNHAETS